MALLILATSFLPYIHDLGDLEFIEDFRKKPGFSGFKSLRSALFIVSLFIFGLSGWIIAFIQSKYKLYRVAIIVPIAMAMYQLLIYLLDKRNTTTNEFNVKVSFNFSVAIILIAIYLIIKYNKAKQ